MGLLHWAGLAFCLAAFITLRSPGLGHLPLWEEAIDACSIRALAAGTDDWFARQFWLAPPMLGTLALPLNPAHPAFIVRFQMLVLALNAVALGAKFAHERPMAPLLGVESRADYGARRTGTAYAAAMQQVNRVRVPSGSLTLFLWEPRTYACQRACLPDSLYDNLVYLVRQHGNAAALAQALAAQGVTHVLVNHKIMDMAVAEAGDPITASDLAVWADLRTNYLRPVYEDGVAYTLYEVLHPVT